MEWLAQAPQEASSALPAWWPIAAVVLPLLIAIIVAFIQMSGAVKSAKIAAESKAAPVPTDVIAEEVARVLGAELDKRLGADQVADAQAAFEKGRREADIAAQEVIEAHRREISELQAQLEAKDAEPTGGRPEALAAAMLYNAGYDVQKLSNLGEAIGLYSAAIRLDPDYAKAFFNRGNAKFDMGDKRGSIEDYDQAVHLDPSMSRALYNCANAKADLGDHIGAIADYSEAIRLEPTYAHAYYNRGNSKVELGDPDGAVADYDRAIALDPNYAAAYYNKACEAAKAGDGLEAMEQLKLSIALDRRWAMQAKGDPDFDAIGDSDAFREIVSDEA